MKTANELYQDIMLQKFSVGSYFNPSRYFILYLMVKDGVLYPKYNINDIALGLFELYSVNQDIAKRHPKLEIRNAPFFGLKAFFDEVKEALYDWKKDATNNTVVFDGKALLFDVDIMDSSIAMHIQTVLKVLLLKNFGIKTMKNPNCDCSNLDDTCIDIFGKCEYRNKLFADAQYCVLCDEVGEKSLYAVHILPRKYSTIEEANDSNNGLLMCREHAIDYIAEKFYFDDRGRVVNLSAESVCEGMRLPIKICRSHKYFIEKNYKRLK